VGRLGGVDAAACGAAGIIVLNDLGVDDLKGDHQVGEWRLAICGWLFRRAGCASGVFLCLVTHFLPDCGAGSLDWVDLRRGRGPHLHAEILGDL
jgi:hypothetical protein